MYQSLEQLRLKLSERIDVQENGCWLWKGPVDQCGYGLTKVKAVEWETHRVHRLMAKIYLPNFSEDLMVLHRCDNPPCCNPEHLFMGNHSDNLNDSYQKGRRLGPGTNKTHCIRGHEFTPENTKIKPNGTRECKRCWHVRNLHQSWKKAIKRRRNGSPK